jgi:hypothetical protein
MADQWVTYPFVPRSNAKFRPGQFWAIPLPDGRFACGRVLGAEDSLSHGEPRDAKPLIRLADKTGSLLGGKTKCPSGTCRQSIRDCLRERRSHCGGGEPRGTKIYATGASGGWGTDCYGGNATIARWPGRRLNVRDHPENTTPSILFKPVTRILQWNEQASASHGICSGYRRRCWWDHPRLLSHPPTYPLRAPDGVAWSVSPGFHRCYRHRLARCVDRYLRGLCRRRARSSRLTAQAGTAISPALWWGWWVSSHLTPHRPGRIDERP